jgi:hypothetical protein
LLTCTRTHIIITAISIKLVFAFYFLYIFASSASSESDRFQRFRPNGQQFPPPLQISPPSASTSSNLSETLHPIILRLTPIPCFKTSFQFLASFTSFSLSSPFASFLVLNGRPGSSPQSPNVDDRESVPHSHSLIIQTHHKRLTVVLDFHPVCHKILNATLYIDSQNLKQKLTQLSVTVSQLFTDQNPAPPTDSAPAVDPGVDASNSDRPQNAFTLYSQDVRPRCPILKSAASSGRCGRTYLPR